MVRRLVIGVLTSLALAAPAAAQQQPRTLSTLFVDIFGPSGLIVSSDEVLVDGTNHAAHFNSAFQSDFRLVNIALTSQLAAMPLPSPASGFTYRFDPDTGTFVRSTTSFGPILTERGETIGKGRLAFGFNSQFFSFDRLDGVRLTNVPAVFTHDDFQAGGGRADVVFTQNTIQASVTQLSGALTYGVTDRVDVGMAVPLISTRLSLISNARIYRVGTGQNTGVHYFRSEAGIDGRGDTNQFYAQGSATGIGDIVLRVKTTVMKESARALAVGLDARLPTGDEQNLLGAGAMGLRGFAAFSTSIGPFAPHLNVGYQWNGSSVLAGDAPDDYNLGAGDPSGTHTHKGDLPDTFQVAAGTDYAINNRLSVVMDLLSHRVIGSPRLSTYQFTASGPAGIEILPDIRFDTASYWVHGGTVGFKTNVATRLLVNFNLRFQINEGGLSDRISPLLGVEWGF